MNCTRYRSSLSRRAHRGGAIARRVVVTVVAIALVVVGEIVATLSASTAHQPPTQHRTHHIEQPVVPTPAAGEPQLSRGSDAPSAPRTAAVRFVRDYLQWSRGRLASIPANDATLRVIRPLEQEGRGVVVLALARAAVPVAIAPAGSDRFMATTPVGNFLLGRHGSRWLVVSLPGD